MIRTALLVALLSSALHTVVAQCRPDVLEAYHTTSAGQILLGQTVERGEMRNGAPNTFVNAALMKGDRTGYMPGTRIRNIWTRRDSAWTRLRIEPFDVNKRDSRHVIGQDGPSWNPGTSIDVMTEWQVDSEQGTHCSLLRATVRATLFVAPTVILKESIMGDPAGVAKNYGRLVLALRDANNPLSPITENSSIIVDTALTPGRMLGSRDIFSTQTTDIIPFDRLPARQIAVTVSIARKQYFRAFVDIAAGCETVMEVYVAPEITMHGPPETPTHATITTCAPVRCFGVNSTVIPCGPLKMPPPPPAKIREQKLQLR